MNDQITAMKILLMTLIFAGLQIQDNLAFGPGEALTEEAIPKIAPQRALPGGPIQDCWDNNKCIKDEHCGTQGKCVWPDMLMTRHGLTFNNIY